MTMHTPIDDLVLAPAWVRRPLALPLAAVAAARWIKRAISGWKRHREMAVLAGADDRMLADIGVTRADLNDAFASRLWDDPTMLLRARALERRLSRSGVSLGFPTPLPSVETHGTPRHERAPHAKP